jgi:hypothetical protein
VPLKPLPRRQGKCRDSPEDEQMQEEVGLEMFESVSGSIIDIATQYEASPINNRRYLAICTNAKLSILLEIAEELPFLLLSPVAD